jgi:excisionase family DNA binding protein
MSERLLTVAEVSELTQFHPEVIRRAIRRGELTASRLFRRLRISESSYRAWVEDNEIDPPEES